MSAFEIPAGYTFKLPNGETFELDLVEACQRINAIRAECSAANLTNFEHVDRFCEWVNQNTGKSLTKTQADKLIDACEIEYMQQKKTVRDKLTSLSSTAPPPLPSTDELDLPSMPISGA